MKLARLRPCPVPLYRHLYAQVGGEYLWWMRRAQTDVEIGLHLANSLVDVLVLVRSSEVLGFVELDYRPVVTVNIAYFGLMKGMIGQGLGLPFLHAALIHAWSRKPRAVTVNTCNADHPNALPTYLKAGFTIVRTVDEIWDIPDRIGISVPERLRIA
jgi:hypothetical protein